MGQIPGDTDIAAVALDWVRRTDRRRVVRVTEAGREHLPVTLGRAPGWDQPAPVSRPLTA